MTFIVFLLCVFVYAVTQISGRQFNPEEGVVVARCRHAYLFFGAPYVLCAVARQQARGRLV